MRIAELPLHYGKCPPWLFKRMKKLGRAISGIIIYEYGQNEFIKKLADPFFFQSLGCTLGFDWHSSGLSTTTLGALKEAKLEDFGIAICGGKGKVSRKTPEEIGNFADRFNLSTKKISRLKYSSMLGAKVDNNLVQDNYNLYHHSFIFTEKGDWCIVQQGMNSLSRYARRYHWLDENVKNFVEEPQSAICCDKKEKNVLDMTAKLSRDARKISVDLVQDNPEHLKKYLKQKTLNEFFGKKVKVLAMQRKHSLSEKDLSPRVLMQLKRAYEIQPGDYEELIALKGIGAKSVRALALISDLIYGEPASYSDPKKFSFTVGGKDGYPYAINRKHYDEVNQIMEDAVKQSKLNSKEKINAIKRLKILFSGNSPVVKIRASQ